VQWGGERLCEGPHGPQFATADAKARFTPVRPPSPTPSNGLRLSTRRGKQFNTMVHAEVDPLTGAGRDSILISEADADRLGLAEGTPVLVRSRHGELRASVHRAPLRPGNVQVFYPEGNVLLPGGRRDRSGVPDYNTTVELVPQ
jgi:anaerobic selenocysteine-containing dehydrogenase